LRDGDDERAIAWGKAIRLAQRLSAGTEGLLMRTSVALDPSTVRLSYARGMRTLHADAVERRLNQLASALGRTAEIRFA
ncbi:MAG: Ppx/GppA family phosphatase, partial [Sphingomicrobium sp.]